MKILPLKLDGATMKVITAKNHSVNVTLKRTLRVADDGINHSLPPGLGNFPLKRIEDYKDTVPKEWLKYGGLFFPMYQREAMWISFGNNSKYPKAVKVATGKINVITGKSWKNELDLNKQNYVVLPDQHWIDGYKTGDGTIRQFVAMPKESGYSVEEQVTGKDEFGGIQLIVYDCSERYKKSKDDDSATTLRARTNTGKLVNDFPMLKHTAKYPYDLSYTHQRGKKKFGGCGGDFENSSVVFDKKKEMSMSYGGKIRQKIIKDRYKSWAKIPLGRVFIRIVSPRAYKQITGEEPPDSDVCKGTYEENGYTWFDVYDEGKEDLEKCEILSKIKTCKEIYMHKKDYYGIDVNDGDW